MCACHGAQEMLGTPYQHRAPYAKFCVAVELAKRLSDEELDPMRQMIALEQGGVRPSRRRALAKGVAKALSVLGAAPAPIHLRGSTLSS